jgi:hypothetical protein
MKTIAASFAALMLSSVAMAGQPADLGEMAGGKSLRVSKVIVSEPACV